jgi:hypothetical protein
MSFYTPNERSQIATPGQHPPYFDPNDLSQKFHAGNAIIFGGLGALAGRNLYRQGAPMAVAALHGVYCAMRWRIWAVTVMLWVSFGIWMALDSTMVVDKWLFYEPPSFDNGYVGFWDYGSANNIFRSMIMLRPFDLTTPRLLWCLNMVIGLFSVGLTYNRCVQECFFKRRMLYKVLAPIEWATHWIPWWVLHSLAVVAPLMPIILYNQMHVIPEDFLDRATALY